MSYQSIPTPNNNNNTQQQQQHTVGSEPFVEILALGKSDGQAKVARSERGLCVSLDGLGGGGGVITSLVLLDLVGLALLAVLPNHQPTNVNWSLLHHAITAASQQTHRFLLGAAAVVVWCWWQHTQTTNSLLLLLYLHKFGQIQA
jgi:hypothetical protein